MSINKNEPVLFRGRKKKNGKWIEGSYIFDQRIKRHFIKECDNEFEIYRDSLQIKVRTIDKESNRFKWVFRDFNSIVNHF